MAARTLPGLGLLGFYNLGEDGWKPGMDSNLRLLSVVAQLQVFSRVASEPGSPSEGDVYILTAGGNLNKVAVYDDGEWIYLTPRQGWLAWIADENQYRKFSGTSWSVLETGGGGGSDDQTAAEVSYDGGSTGFVNVQEALDALFAGGGGGGGGGASYGYASINAQTGTSYTPVLGDKEGVLITLSNSSPVAFYLPQDSEVAFPVGSVIEGYQLGAGLVSVFAGTGATVNARGGAVDSAGQYSFFAATKVAANTWALTGDLV